MKGLHILWTMFHEDVQISEFEVVIDRVRPLHSMCSINGSESALSDTQNMKTNCPIIE